MPPSTSDTVKIAGKITTLKKSDSQISTIKRTIDGNTGIEEAVQIYIPTDFYQLLPPCTSFYHFLPTFMLLLQTFTNFCHVPPIFITFYEFLPTFTTFRQLLYHFYQLLPFFTTFQQLLLPSNNFYQLLYSFINFFTAFHQIYTTFH